MKVINYHEHPMGSEGRKGTYLRTTIFSEESITSQQGIDFALREYSKRLCQRLGPHDIEPEIDICSYVIEPRCKPFEAKYINWLKKEGYLKQEFPIENHYDVLIHVLLS